MLNKNILLASGLILFTGIACTLLSRFSQTSPPSQQVEPTPFTPSAVLTFENQIITAEIPVTGLRVLGEHHVALGETLRCIGHGYGVLPEAIAGFNQIDPESELQVGQVLKIPAIIWKDIPPGPGCLPQFDIAEWQKYVREHSQTTAIPTPTAIPTNTQISINTQRSINTKISISPTKTLRGGDNPTQTQCPPNIQVPCGGPTLGPMQCCDTCLIACTYTPQPIHEVDTDTPIIPTTKIPPPPPTVTFIIITFPPPPTVTPIPIMLPPPPICFPPPCLPTFPPFP